MIARPLAPAAALVWRVERDGNGGRVLVARITRQRR